MNSKTFLLAVVFVFGLLPILALAQAAPLVYKPLVGVPGLNGSTNFGDYINALYGLSIAVAALMAVIKIIIAGVKYMLSDVVTSKQEAIGDIKGSLLGLGVVISAVLVLTIINPQLTKTEIFIDPNYNPQSNVPTSTASIIPINTPGRFGGYYYRETHPDPGFQQTCEATPGQIYTVASAGRNEVCYENLPTSVESDLFNIFTSTAFNMSVITERYMTAHRPRMITDLGRLTNIANAENSKGRVSSDVVLAVEFKDGSSENPPVYMDWIDAANKASINDTCLKFQQAFSISTIPVKIQSVGSLAKGYLACVRMP